MTYEEEQAREKRVRFWQDKGVWWCAEVRKDPLEFLPGRKQPWWKHYGLRGKGNTRKAAFADWQSWMWASDFVSGIY